MSSLQTEELKRLRSIVKTLGDTCVMTMHPGTHKMLVQSINGLKERIADLEAQQQKVDPWAEVKRYIDQSPDKGSNTLVKRYIRHLEAKVAELEEEIGANESEAYLGDFRVLKTAQDIAKYAGSNDIPSCQKAFCRNLIKSINDFTLYVRTNDRD